MQRLKYSPYISLLFAICILPLSAAAESEPEYLPLTKNQYEKLLPGKTITGEYRFMRERTRTYNFSEKHYANGTTDYVEGRIKARGQWYALGERKVCYKYKKDSEMGGQTSCFWVYKSDGCYYGYSISEMTLSGPRDYNDWAARWIIDGSRASCAAPVS